MSEQKKSKKGVLIASACLVLAAAALLAVWLLASPGGTAGHKQITVEVIHADGSNRSFELSTHEEYLGPALVDGGVVADNQGPYGLYILTADGETAQESAQQWWKVTRNGEMVNTGADATPIGDGEHYELTLTTGYDGF